MIFDRVTEIHIGDEKTGYKPLDYSKKNRRLYKVAVNIYNATLLSLVKKFTKGILEITPKDREGNPFGDLKLARVDKDKNQPGVQELTRMFVPLSSSDRILVTALSAVLDMR